MPNTGPGVSCHQEALPGGGSIWTYEAVQPHLPNGGTVTSSTPIDVMSHSVLVVAADGSALDLMEFAELPGDGDDLPLPTTGAPGPSTLAALARSTATAWQAAA